MLYAFFFVIPWRLNFICRRFGTLFYLHMQTGVESYPPIKMEQTECYETSAYKIQMPENYPEENIQQSTFLLPVTKNYCIFSSDKNDII
jgi:hypothetical protein